jgi:predicted signal transduction protein with EAL and GGDEF domain
MTNYSFRKLTLLYHIGDIYCDHTTCLAMNLRGVPVHDVIFCLIWLRQVLLVLEK